MITMLMRKHIRYDASNRDVCRVFIAVTTASDLPTKYGITGVTIDEGSRAWDITGGEYYGWTDANGWEKQKATGLDDVIIIKGRVNTVSDLPSEAEPGWLYFVGLSTDTEMEEYVYTVDGRWEFIGYNTITIDTALSTTSENPVQNKVIASALGGKADNSTTVTNVSYDASTHKLKKTVNGTDSDAMTVDTAINSQSENPVANSALATLFTPMTQNQYDALVTKTEPIYFIYET